MHEHPDPAYRIFVSYIDKSREFYAAQGYERPYRWAAYCDAPFARLPKPLAQCRVGIVTTSSPWGDGEDAVDRARLTGTYAMPSDPPPDRMFTDHRSWDKEETHTNDVESFLPLGALASLANDDRIASVSPRFYGIQTDYSQRRTNEVDAPALHRLLQEDGVDVALLVPL